MERERVEQERAEQKRAEQERAEQERVEQELVFRRLKPVETSYDCELRCMDGTRQSLLNQIMDWVSHKSGQENVFQRNVYWIFGSPGIGKTSLAHSICTKLNERNHLAGAFFCRRDDPNLSDPINILPTFIHKLAILSPPFRTIVAKHLHDDPNLTPESINGPLFLDFIRSLPRQPEHTLVFVIDALDECGDAQSRPRLLKVLTTAAAQVPWLKIIVTSRAEVDIQHFFGTLTHSSYFPYDLATDQDASADLRTYARSQFDLVVSHWHLNAPWPEESDFNRVIIRANGLFIFIKTLVLALKRCDDPEETLKAALQDSAGSGLESLYEPYSSAIREHNRIIDDTWAFHRQQEPRLDPVLALPPELVHYIFMEAVQWFDLKYGMDDFLDIPRSIADVALTLVSVSKKWGHFVLKDPRLWSQILIDTNDPESPNHLQWYLHLSGKTTLFIVLRGSSPISGTQLELLMQESNRIGLLIHPHNQPLIRLDDMASTMRDSPEALLPFIELEVYNASHKPKPSKYFLYPPSIHTLRLYGFCPYSMMSALSSFQLLTELLVDIFPPAEGMTSQPLMPIVFPKLQTLFFGIRWWSKGDWKLSRLISCPSLKKFHLNAHFQINVHSFRAFAVMLNDLTCFPLLESLECTLNMIPSKRNFPSIRNQSWLHESLDILPQVPPDLHYVSLHVIRTGHGQGRKYPGLIWERFENLFIERMPPLTDLITSQLRNIDAPYLRRLFLRLLPAESPSSILSFPHLELLEVQSKYGYDHFVVLEQIRAPNLEKLYIIISRHRGHCKKTTFDCRDITGAKRLHISLQVDSDDRILTFRLPPCLSLAVCGWMELHISEPLPLLYSFETGKEGSDYMLQYLDALMMSAVTRLKDAFGGFIGPKILTRFTSLRNITLSIAHKISTPSSTDELLRLLAENVHICPFLTSVTLSEYPSNWESFLSALRTRNCAGLFDERTSIIHELKFLQGLHRNIIECLRTSIEGKFVKLTSPPCRQGNLWPARPIMKTKELYRSCYLCHISGFELGCMQSETQAVDCGRERGQVVTIMAI